MSNNKQQDSGDVTSTIVRELSAAERFFGQNKKVLTIVLGSLAGLVVLYFAFQFLYLGPQEESAQEALVVVERQFARDSFELVVKGNGKDLSAPEIADSYGLTKAGNIAAYIAGMSYLKLGQFDEAISYLKKFDGKDKILQPLAIGAMGDAYVELKEIEKGAAQYLKAAKLSKNDLTTPYFYKKAGVHFEEAGKYDKAIQAYETVQKQFQKTPEAVDIEKFIYRAKAKAGKL